MTSSPTIIGRYEIRGRIGQGGMGVLYRAWDPRLDRLVAIKLLIGDNPELRERFAREARSAARLRHPHIVLIFDVGEHEGQPFIAMEYIQGQTLGEMITARAALPVVRKLELVEELCDGLAFAHKTGVIHRDIKPANAMVDAGGALKILDFGIARLTESSGMTQSGMLIGTLNYMSPEQVMGREIDNRSDIFAVGALFYELLAYRQAFPGGLQNGILNRILQGQREPIASVCPGLDPDVVRIVDQSLELDPGRRYQDLTVMRKDLQRVRFRLEESLTEPTELNRPQGRSAPVAPPTPVATPSPSPRRTAAREDLERRRATQIEVKLDEAKRALAAKDFDAALALSEEALLLDADHARAIELHDQSRAAVDERHANELLDEADRERRLGALTAALSIIDRADAICPTLPRAIELRNSIDGELRTREEARRRAERVRQAVDLAGASFDAGQFTQAIAAADQALALDPTLVEAISLKSRAADAIKVRERQAEERRLEAERRAKQQRIVAELHAARVEIGRQQFPGAISRLQKLEAAEGGSAEISAAIREAQAGQAALEHSAHTADQVRAHLANAEGLFSRREWTAALVEADNACALDPKNKTALALRSRIWDAVHQAEEDRRSEARRLADAESRRLADAEAKRTAEAEAKRLAEAEAKRIADAEARRRADAEARRLAEAEAKRLADGEARRRAEADARRAAEAVSRAPAPQPEVELPTLISGGTGGGAPAVPPVTTQAPLGPTLTPGRSLNPTFVGAAAGAVVVIGIAGYFLIGRGPAEVRPADAPVLPATSTVAPQPDPVASPATDATPPGAAAPATSSAPSAPAASTSGNDNLEESLKKFRDNARAQLARGARPDALASTTEGLKLAPNDAQLRILLDEMLREARTRLASARAAAAAGGRQASSSPSAPTAARLEQEAARLERRQEIDPAIRAMWVAADAYVKVGEEARRGPGRAEAPSGAPPLQPLPSQRLIEQTPAPVVRGTTPAEIAPAPPPAAAAVPVPTPATVDERPAISRVLRAYEQAYADLSPNAVAKIYPSVDLDGLKRGFDQLRSMQVQLQNEQIRVEGANAVVTGTWLTIARAKVGAAQQASASIELRLQKSQNGWTIVSRSMR